MLKTEIKKTAHIYFTNNCGGKGTKAWVIKESYNGEMSMQMDRIAKREFFIELHTIVLDYLERGYQIEIDNYDNYLISKGLK
jgi:hypothetical protein